MSSLFIGFICGFLLFPLLYAFVPAFFGFSKKIKKAPVMLNPSIPISGKLKNQIKNSLIQNVNLGWINVMIQRIFFDSIRNYYLEHKIKQNMMKSFASSIGEGLLRNIKIKSLNFGAEAPYLKNIRLITPEEFKKLIKEHSDPVKIEENAIKNAETMHYNGKLNEKMIEFEITGERTYINEATGVLYEKSSPKQTNLPKSTIVEAVNSEEKKSDDVNCQEIFKNATFYGSIEYNGTIQMMIEVELPKGISVSLTITLRRIESDFLFRIPAINSNTRYEITLINEPVIDVDVDSGLITELKKLYFQGSISGFIKRIVLSSFKSTMVYPSWQQLAQSSVPSSRFPPFYPLQISSNDFQSSFDALDQILLIVSSDFKLNIIKNEILYKRSHFLLNEKNFVYSWCFKVSKQIGTCGDFSYFEGLTSNESKVLFYIQTPDGLKDLFPMLKSSSIIFEQKNVSIIKMMFGHYEMEFVRVIFKNNVIFYRNSPRFCEFIVFKVQDGDLSIFNYSDKSSDLFFNDRRVEKLKKVIASGNFISGTKIKIDDDESLEESETKNFNFETMFKEALQIDNCEFNRFESSLKMTKNVLKGIIKDPEARIKMFDDYAKFVGSINETRHVKTLIAEYKSIETGEIEEIRIHSFRDKKFTVDICPKRNQIFVYKIKKIKKLNAAKVLNPIVALRQELTNNFISEEIEDLVNTAENQVDHRANQFINPVENQILLDQTEELKVHLNSPDCIKSDINQPKCILEILYKSEIPKFFPNFFIESIKIKESFQKYFEITNKMEFSRSPNELKLETYVSSGTIYMEFKCEYEDDYSLEIFSCKKQIVIFHISKIITSKIFRMIYPVDNDYIKIYFTPKNKRNSFLDYKFKEFPYKKDTLVEGLIGLRSNEKLKLKIEGSPSHVIFWDLISMKPVRSYIQDVYGKTDVNDCGILRADAKEYVFAHKNSNGKQRNIKIYAGLTEFR